MSLVQLKAMIENLEAMVCWAYPEHKKSIYAQIDKVKQRINELENTNS